MKPVLVLAAFIPVTLVGHDLIKMASQKPSRLTAPAFIFGAMLYAFPAAGWFHLMSNHTLPAISVISFAGTIPILAGLETFVLTEAFDLREALGTGLAVAAVSVVIH